MSHPQQVPTTDIIAAALLNGFSVQLFTAEMITKFMDSCTIVDTNTDGTWKLYNMKQVCNIYDIAIKKSMQLYDCMNVYTDNYAMQYNFDERARFANFLNERYTTLHTLSPNASTPALTVMVMGIMGVCVDAHNHVLVTDITDYFLNCIKWYMDQSMGPRSVRLVKTNDIKM